MKPEAYGLSHIGNKRSNNQDSILIDKELSIYAVADGMGGHSLGEVASALAIETFRESVKKFYQLKNFSPEIHLIKAFKEANFQVFSKNQEQKKDNISDMGTTLVTCMIWNNVAYFANVGDSRAYLFRDPHIWVVTEDHSVINDQIKKSLVDKNQPLINSNIITRSIGFFDDVDVDLVQRKIDPDDLFFLCSDGLNKISDQSICELIKNYSVKSLPKKCIDAVLEGPADDNISIIFIQP